MKAASPPDQVSSHNRLIRLTLGRVRFIALENLVGKIRHYEKVGLLDTDASSRVQELLVRRGRSIRGALATRSAKKKALTQHLQRAEVVFEFKPVLASSPFAVKDRLQTKGARAALKRAFDASAEEIGEAAVALAKGGSTIKSD